MILLMSRSPDVKRSNVQSVLFLCLMTGSLGGFLKIAEKCFYTRNHGHGGCNHNHNTHNQCSQNNIMSDTFAMLMVVVVQ